MYLFLFILLLLILFPLCCTWHVLLFVGAIVMAAEDAMMCKQSTSGKGKDVSLAIV